MDGTRYATNGDNVAYYIRNHFSNILEAHDDGWMGVINIDSVAHRIKLIPLNDPEQPNGFTAPTIQAAIYHQSGSTDYFPSLNAVCENSNYEAWDQAIPEPETGYVGSCRPIGGTGGYSVYKDIGTTPHPTFIEHEDGSLTFCLAPNNEEF
ncbi:hypothetical protein [Acinetobacter sp.]